MTTTDTRAALDAAIDALIVRRADAIAGANDDLPAERAARKAIDRAITAHVDAEVTRRLACAPGVGEAIFTAVEASKSVGFARGSNEDCSDALRALDAALSILRTAIAADRERAIRDHDATWQAHDLERDAEVARWQGEAHALVRALKSIAAAVGAPDVPSGDGWAERVAAAVMEAVAAYWERAVASARPTPEEARRMVDALREAARALDAYQHAGDDPHPSTLERLAGNVSATRKALLRALGVEA